MGGATLLKPTSQAPQELVPVTLPRAGLDKATNHEAAIMFEGLVMMQMFQAMRKTIQPSGLFGEDAQTRSTYDYLLDQAVVEHAMSSGRTWGLAERMEKTWEEQRAAGPPVS